MTTATVDRSEFRHVLQSGTIVGAATAVAVILFLAVSRLLLPGMVTSVLLMVIVLALAFIGSSLISHSPSADAVVLLDWPPKRTVTDSPGSALPQMGTLWFCCSTIPSLITSGSKTFPRA